MNKMVDESLLSNIFNNAMNNSTFGTINISVPLNYFPVASNLDRNINHRAAGSVESLIDVLWS